MPFIANLKSNWFESVSQVRECSAVEISLPGILSVIWVRFPGWGRPVKCLYMGSNINGLEPCSKFLSVVFRLVSYSLSFGEIRALAKRTKSLKWHQPLTHVRHASQAARRLAGMTCVNGAVGQKNRSAVSFNKCQRPTCGHPTTGPLSVYENAKIRHSTKRSIIPQGPEGGNCYSHPGSFAGNEPFWEQKRSNPVDQELLLFCLHEKRKRLLSAPSLTYWDVAPRHHTIW